MRKNLNLSGNHRRIGIHLYLGRGDNVCGIHDRSGNFHIDDYVRRGDDLGQQHHRVVNNRRAMPLPVC